MSRPIHVVAALMAVLAGCGDGPTSPSDPVRPEQPPDVRAFVTGAARDNLDGNGHFRLDPPSVEGPYSIISAEDAEVIALGVIRTWYANPNVLVPEGTRSLVDVVEEQHGAVIAWSDVEAAPSGGYFAESHLVPLPTSMGNTAIRSFGPHYLVPMYVGATPVMVVSVSAYATNVFIDARGFVSRTDNSDGGGEFFSEGIPLEMNAKMLPLAPEAAVAHVYEQTRTQVAAVPVLGAWGNRIAPTGARWRVVLAEPVEFERIFDGAEVSADTVYVDVRSSIVDARRNPSSIRPGWFPRIFVAAPEQPSHEEIGPNRVPLQTGYAVDLHEVQVAK